MIIHPSPQIGHHSGIAISECHIFVRPRYQVFGHQGPGVTIQIPSGLMFHWIKCLLPETSYRLGVLTCLVQQCECWNVSLPIPTRLYRVICPKSPPFDSFSLLLFFLWLPKKHEKKTYRITNLHMIICCYINANHQTKLRHLDQRGSLNNLVFDLPAPSWNASPLPRLVSNHRYTETKKRCLKRWPFLGEDVTIREKYR